MRQYSFFILIILTLLNFSVKAQDKLTTELDKVTFPFSLNNSSPDLLYLDTLLKNKIIVGLGEESHGTKEFFLAKTEVIKYCIAHLHFKSIGIEADFTGTQYINEYVTKGTGNIKTGLYNMGIAAWMTEEMTDLMEWLKLYNSDKTLDERVSFFGYDMQFANATVEELKAKYINLNILSKEPWIYLDSITKWKNSEQVNLEKWKQLESELIKYKSSIQSEDQEKFMNLIMILNQNISYKSSKSLFEKFNYRDKFMADNIKLMHDRNKNKMIVWAHNEHISKGETFQHWKTMGNHLQQYYNDKYYAVTLLTEIGSIGFYNAFQKTKDSLTNPEETKNNSIDKVLSKCEKSLFYIDLKYVSSINPTVNKFISDKYFARSIDCLKHGSSSYAL